MAEPATLDREVCRSRMGISLAQIAALHPRLYHMAEAGTWRTIQEHGLLSTSALLDLYGICGEARFSIESRLRREMTPIRGTNGALVWLRDQRPMNERKLASCLGDELKPVDWYRILNGKVFFWLNEDRLNTLLRAYQNRAHLVLEVDTEALLKKHGSQVSLTPLNTGCTSPMAFPRGLNSFLPPHSYPFAEYKRKKGGAKRAIVELTVDHAVQDIGALTLRATHRIYENGGAKVIEVLCERR